MIFTKDDFAAPNNSECFKALRNIQEANVAELSDYLAELCSLPVEQVPDLESILLGAPVSAPTPVPAHDARFRADAPVPPPVPIVPTSSAPPPASGSAYRNLILTGQSHTPPPAITSAPPSPAQAIQCSQCKQANSSELIYCANESCAAVIQTGGKTCNACRSFIPLNAFFCPECGVRLVVPVKV